MVVGLGFSLWGFCRGFWLFLSYPQLGVTLSLFAVPFKGGSSSSFVSLGHLFFCSYSFLSWDFVPRPVVRTCGLVFGDLVVFFFFSFSLFSFEDLPWTAFFFSASSTYVSCVFSASHIDSPWFFPCSARCLKRNSIGKRDSVQTRSTRLSRSRLLAFYFFSLIPVPVTFAAEYP